MLGEAETQEGKNRVAKALNTVIAQCKKNVSSEMFLFIRSKELMRYRLCHSSA